ncbi:VOC family protein [Rhodococcoides corynebacterioides]|uniref:VOC family protein n=1 Tax=Rhodococcoides corynebacterioides TaxID=53972 RepID=UPI00082AEAEC|nr:VOC family protein [Rhodococcus corynebacterioides]MBY6349290.1 VOC family protein [Rhodococcus corynebacterioides]MBY6362878.1 VOC family protein [Rhodococcus corynebacterioides]
MTRMLFVNTYVEDVASSRSFFGALGFEFNDAFSDENTASMIVNDATTVMLLARPKFQEFILDEMTDTSRSREMLLAVSADSREAVDTLADTALRHGGSAWTDPQDHGFMYGRSFRDLDGHVWEVIWMDPAVAAGDGPPDM